MINEEHSTIQVSTNTSEDTGGPLNNKTSSFKFKFDHVFHNTSQSAVYDLFARDTVQSVVDGINGAIMSYGQTGSGKTFTMVRELWSSVG
jgi:kinesin family protein 6/9